MNRNPHAAPGANLYGVKLSAAIAVSCSPLLWRHEPATSRSGQRHSERAFDLYVQLALKLYI